MSAPPPYLFVVSNKGFGVSSHAKLRTNIIQAKEKKKKQSQKEVDSLKMRNIATDIFTQYIKTYGR